MSRRGNCWDNSPMERFFRSLKNEWMSVKLQRRCPCNNRLYRWVLQCVQAARI
ncbi:TPA: hypothetical protein SJ159_004297 [Yersinia enterocolitica]|nr:hypothetical protein [Yersinia enterocolitica]